MIVCALIPANVTANKNLDPICRLAHIPLASLTLGAKIIDTIDRFTSRNPPFIYYSPVRVASMSRRGVTVVGLAAAGGVGYYLYTAGGDPNVAQKNFKGLFIPYDCRRTAS